jgi:anti-sigma factor RsiW
MDNCPTEQNLSAYHDGELTTDDRAAMARHLAWCQACIRRMEQFKQMSVFITSGTPTGLSQIALRRLHNKLDEVIERGLVRFAWEVSGIAAAILLIGSVWLARLNEPTSVVAPISTAVAVPPWVGAQASADPVVEEVPTPAAAWYLADARNSSEINP